MTRALGLNEDIAEAVALAHDLGHPPFGHAGEDALNIAMQDFGGFDHNEQSLRVLTLLEHRYARFDGLNLTFETIDGVLKHNGPLLKAGQDKHPLRQTIKDLDARWGLDLDLFPTAEAQIANLSDDIAYLSHDFDDALRAELLSLEQIADLPVVGRILAELKSEYGILPMGRLTHELTRRLISHFVQDLLTYSHQLLGDFAPKTADDIRHASHPMIGHSTEAAADLRVLRDFLMTNSWRHYKVNRMTSKSRKALAALFQRFCEEVNLLPTDWQKLAASGDEKHKARVIADYLASMTDRYALLEYERILKPGQFSVKMNIFSDFEDYILTSYDEMIRSGAIATPDQTDTSKIVVELPREDAHGDLACNAAMVLSKQTRMKPRELANLFAEKLARVQMCLR